MIDFPNPRAAIVALAAVAGCLGCGGTAPRVDRVVIAQAAEAREGPASLADGPVRNVVLLVGDGMGESQVLASRIHRLGLEGRFHFERLPVTGLVLTHSADRPVAKSDSAATALATGVKTRNGRVGTEARGQAVRSLLEELAARGWATGLVTTTRITDATPAAFVTHVPERRLQEEIAAQLVLSPVDLLAGGGRRFFLPAERPDGARADGRNLLAEAEARGVRVVADAAGWNAAGGLPLYAIFEREPQENEPRSPTVSELARHAIDLLAGSGRPFFLLIEEEEIDTAAHRRDFERMSRAVDRIDAAVRVATDFAAHDGRTLVLLTGDHSTGSPMIDHASSDEELVVQWESAEHTGEAVPLFAYGPPSAAIRFSGVFDNTEVPVRIAAALGFDFPPVGGGAQEGEKP